LFFLKKNFFFKKKYFGLNKLDEKILKYLNYDKGFFVELGANDGISQSNTLHFERYKNWKGILIEPIKFKYDRCVNIRSKKNIFFNCACVSKDYSKKRINLIYSDLRSVTIDSNNLVVPTQHINSDDLNIYQTHKEYSVEARTLNSLFIESECPKIMDFLSLDTEGYEIEILKGIDFKEYRFKYMLIESRDIEVLDNFLKKKSYQLIDKLSKHDFLFGMI
jgi:FkbM family methyltransferase